MSKKLNTRHLVIDLFLGAASTQLNIKEILIGAKILGASENGVRVAVTRLTADGMLETTERGIYQLTTSAQYWARLMLNRKQGIKMTKVWQNKYLAVFTGNLGRVDRTALKKRERALYQYGFREFETNIYIRPDNLIDSFDILLQELQNLGLETTAKMCVIEHFDSQTQTNLHKLWQTKKLNQSYTHYIQQLENWLKNVSKLTLEQAAYESFHLGRETISLLMQDPLLPKPYVDEDLREEFAHLVQKLDQTGLKIWQKIYENHDSILLLA